MKQAEDYAYLYRFTRNHGDLQGALFCDPRIADNRVRDDCLMLTYSGSYGYRVHVHHTSPDVDIQKQFRDAVLALDWTPAPRDIADPRSVHSKVLEAAMRLKLIKELYLTPGWEVARFSHAQMDTLLRDVTRTGRMKPRHFNLSPPSFKHLFGR